MTDKQTREFFRVKIVKDEGQTHAYVVDVETGKRLNDVVSISWESCPDSIPYVTIVLNDVALDVGRIRDELGLPDDKSGGVMRGELCQQNGGS